MIRKFIAAFALMFLVMSSTALAEEIDWDKAEKINYRVKFDPITRTLRAKGIGMPPGDYKAFYKSNYWIYAIQVARMDALTGMAEALGGVIIEKKIEDGKEIVVSKMSHDSEVFKFLEQNARQIYVTYYEDSTVELTMEVIVPEGWEIKS